MNQSRVGGALAIGAGAVVVTLVLLLARDALAQQAAGPVDGVIALLAGLVAGLGSGALSRPVRAIRGHAAGLGHGWLDTRVLEHPAQPEQPAGPVLMDRFDKFSDGARKVLTLAQDEAQRFDHNYIGTEHLLLALIREEGGVAAQVLVNLGVELPKVRTAVEFIIGRGDRPIRGEVGLTPAPSASSSWRSTRPDGSAITTSAPSICSSASSARARVSPLACSSPSASAWTRSATRSFASSRRARRSVRAGEEAGEQDADRRPARHQPDREQQWSNTN